MRRIVLGNHQGLGAVKHLRQKGQRHRGRWIKRHTLVTRLTHWVWAVSLFFLLLTGLQIFNAHPVLYLGDQSGFEFDNTVLRIGARDTVGFVDLWGWRVETTGLFGWSDGTARAFPAWMTIPSFNDLATGRVIHFFFAWVFVGVWILWGVGAVLSGHLVRDLMMWRADWAGLLQDVRAHLRLRIHHGARYGPLQRLSYAAVLFGLFPLAILTGLAMSPGANAIVPWVPDLFGGRQTARTIHFCAAFALSAFVVVHLVMVLLGGPIGLVRSMLTGWVMADQKERSDA